MWRWSRFRALVNGRHSAIWLLVISASTVILLTVLAGFLVYASIRQMISSEGWVQHTDEVIAELQRVSLMTERVEYRSHLYLATGKEDELTRANFAASQLNAGVERLRLMVADNVNQNANVSALSNCARDLGHSLESLRPSEPIRGELVSRCQQVLSMMDEQEHRLRLQRNQGSQRSSYLSIRSEVGFMALSLLAMAVLFGLLLRDALKRERASAEASLANRELAKSIQAMEYQAQESELLTHARDELQLCVDVQQVYATGASAFARLLEGTGGGLCMINNSRQLVEVMSRWGEGAVEDFHAPDSCCGLRSGHGRWRQAGVSEIHCAHFGDRRPEQYLCLPIVAHGNTLGVLYVECPDEAAVALVKTRLEGVRQLLQLAGMTIATLNLRVSLENQSIRDPLTGLFNRHFMQISLERELSRAARRSQSLAVLMLDIDHFKKFNDANGHAAGDTALRAVAESFRNHVRAEDIVCRYGGEEFTVILPDINGASAYQRAEMIRRAVAGLQIPLDREAYGQSTVSIGVAMYPQDGESADLLLRRADQCLYRAKRNGRNQVMHGEADLGSAFAGSGLIRNRTDSQTGME